jgi:selenocysteine lyase/cysteine desulfurase
METLKPQRELFNLPDGLHYLNGAYMSPLLKSVEAAGVSGMIRKRNPTTIDPLDFFSEAELLKAEFAKLINSEADQVAIIPSASYGLNTAISNIPKNNGNEALILSAEFPSAYYALERWCRENNKQLKTIEAPEERKERGRKWNQLLLDSINDNTAVVVLSSVHWTDGTIFDLQEIGKKCKAHDAVFIVDGTQSVGALPIDVDTDQIDALICSGYKWLLGPYALGLAYFNPGFNQGKPIEESWMNRADAQIFSGLTNYNNNYRSGANRYNVGQFSNFILVPMLSESIRQINEWSPASIQQYGEALTQPLIEFFTEQGITIEEDCYRSKHITGITLPKPYDSQKILDALRAQQIYISKRGNALRISAHIYNTTEDIDVLVTSLKKIMLK